MDWVQLLCRALAVRSSSSSSSSSSSAAAAAAAAAAQQQQQQQQRQLKLNLFIHTDAALSCRVAQHFQR